ncbi:6322_t:CDS:2 [Paraglomus brasilianum]|uniref:6322_t:CDS:1 n=1 Tax=Paraglomus brasilianum TaxID=144538 RepID=A0A9N9GFP7_9GLOM|nr:6322_t:CDS:2 [Paraglomus brasilianum]
MSSAKKIDLNELDISTLSLPFKIWVKYGNVQPCRVVFDREVEDLKEVVKKRLSPKLNETDLDQIILCKADLEPGAIVDLISKIAPLKRKYEDLREIIHKIKNKIEESVEKQVTSKPRYSLRSKLSGVRIEKILDDLGLLTLEPLHCQPFQWDLERDKDQQMPDVKRWFKNVLNLPRNTHVKDIHTQVKHQRHLQGANITIMGGSNISVGPSLTPCIWIETKKSVEDFIEGQAIGATF